MEVLGQAGIVTLIGMGVVFLFLTLLVFVMGGLAAVAKNFPDKEEPAKVSGKKSGGDAEIAVAIAAVKAFTKT